MNDNLPKEYFELIRKVVHEKAQSDSVTNDRPLKRRRRNNVSSLSQESHVPTEVINIDSESDKDNVSQSDVQSEYQSEYDSDDFEDVSDNENVEQAIADNISISIEKGQNTVDTKKTQVRNVCDNEEKKRRKFLHMSQLLCLMCHGFIRNEWLNSTKLMNKLNRLIPDKTFELLHPQKDEDLILRSTRKLLDGLKQAMEIWQKHWKIVQKYHNSKGLYMNTWDELNDLNSSSKESLSKQNFIKQILKGIGDRDIATQGFVSLLRSCNVNARLVMSCQPCDFTNLKEHSKINKIEYDQMIKYPIFWCEVWDKFAKKWITVDPMNLKTIEQVKRSSRLEPKGTACCKRNMIRYVIGYDRKQGCRDITRRYVRWLNAKTRKRRITKDPEGDAWYNKVLSALHRRKRTKIDDYEDEYFCERDEGEGMPDNLSDLHNHPYYILEKDLRVNQILRSGCKECGYVQQPHKSMLKVYARKDIIELKSGRQWYNEGRILKTASHYLKVIQRKGRDGEIEDERLYPKDATEIFKANLASYPLGEITKNTFGNIEIFTPNMIPGNCCLIESPVAIKAAKFLGIQFAPAVTKFKFERGRKAKAVISGVVVAEWFKDAVVTFIDGIEYIQDETKRREEELKALDAWKVLLLKLRIKDNLNSTYGSVQESVLPEVADVPDTESGGFFVSGSKTIGDDEEEEYEENEREEYTSEGQVTSNELEEGKEDIDKEYEMFMKDLL